MEDEASDEELEARWKQGSTPAFATLFERYHDRAFAFALRLTNDRHLAEDLAQRAFLNILKKPPPGTGRAMFRTLLFTVVRNEALNDLKRRGRRRESTLDGAPDPKGPGDRPDELAGKEEEARRVRAALAELPDDERELVLLRTTEGLTFREVCEVTGLTRDTVRWRLARGLATLKRLLEAPPGAEGKQGTSWTATAPTS
jgi:RNA polymerase sigma-70 factor, ECF subfamily